MQEEFAGVVARAVTERSRRVESLRRRMSEVGRQACPERSRRVEALRGRMSEAGLTV
jgi:hypothetical protein